MNEHLSPGEISQWMVGDRPSGGERHVSGCDACRDEIALLESALREFRGAVHACAVPTVLVLSPKRRLRRAVSWALTAVAASMLLVAVPVYRHRQQAAETARADAILLDQVDAEVSQAVPRPMQPLVPLVSWSSSSEATTKGDGEKQ